MEVDGDVIFLSRCRESEIITPILVKEQLGDSCGLQGILLKH